MSELAKRVVNRSVSAGMGVANRLLQRNPRLKSYVRRSLEPYIALRRAGGGDPMDDVPYGPWALRHVPTATELLRQREQARDLPHQPLISVCVATYDTDPDFLRDCIDSVRAQSYENWELCLVDDCSPHATVREVIESYAAVDPRIRYRFRTENGHISVAQNDAIEMAQGEFCCFVDHDDVVWPNALFEFAKAISAEPDLDVLYTDEDKIVTGRDHHDPHFKPDWNPDFMLSVNYMTHLTCARTSLVREVGGFLTAYNGAQDWDLYLRLTERTDRVHHIPKVLYSWRVHAESTASDVSAKPYAVAAQRKAVTDALARRGVEATVAPDDRFTPYWTVTYAVQGDPLVSIVIPSKDKLDLLKRCVDSIYGKTRYQHVEVVVVDTGTTDRATLQWYRDVERIRPDFRVVDWHGSPFSFSEACNLGAREARGEIVVFLNNDTEVITSTWLELLVGDAQRPEVGAVGPLLLYGDGRTIQHAGIGLGIGDLVAANSFAGCHVWYPFSSSQHLMVHTRHNVSAVTGACLAMRRDLFLELGGFDPLLRVTYQDVDLCLRLGEAGYRIVYTPKVCLLHHEGKSIHTYDSEQRDRVEMREAVAVFKQRWQRYLDHDPHRNPNFHRGNAFYALADDD